MATNDLFLSGRLIYELGINQTDFGEYQIHMKILKLSKASPYHKKIMTKLVLQLTDLCDWSWIWTTSSGIDRNCWNCRQRDFCHDGFCRTQWLCQAACFQDLRKLLFCKNHLNEKRDVIYDLSVLVIFKIMHRGCLKLIFQNMFKLILIFVLKE